MRSSFFRFMCAASLLALSGCALFSTPGRVTSSDFTSEVGGVYLHVMQPANGIGCPSAIAGGAQTMGGIDATCTDAGKTQTIHAVAPDPNPALTTAYAGINAQAQIFADLAAKIIAAGMTAGAGPAAPLMAARALAPRLTSVPTNQPCPPGTLPVTISAGSTVCQ